MVLIFSDNNDVITKRVLSELECRYCVIYSDKVIENIGIRIGSTNDFFSLEDKNWKLNLSDITYIWHRRGLLKFTDSMNRRAEFIVNSLEKEVKFLILSAIKILNNLPHLSLPKHEHQNNKIYNLIIAKKFGLNIPKTLITNSKKDVENSLKFEKEFVTKGIYSLFEYNNPDKLLCRVGTVRVEEDDLNELSDRFFPSLFQEEIKKSFEIRSFYFLGKTYSIAIMSQENEETQLDFRDYSVFTRIQRYKLPSEVEKKVDKLMKTLGLKIGVLDFIYGLDEEIYFLEINPTGQIMRISELGNYQLDKLIANHLNQAVNG